MKKFQISQHYIYRTNKIDRLCKSVSIIIDKLIVDGTGFGYDDTYNLS